MSIDELRRQVSTTAWPIFLRVDSKDVEVGSRDDLMIPTVGNLICVYQAGAFEVLDTNHIAAIRRDKSIRGGI
jgi:hypothetical protein